MAGPNPSHPPLVARTGAVSIPWRTLPSGLTVVTERMEGAETVSLGAYVATGSCHKAPRPEAPQAAVAQSRPAARQAPATPCSTCRSSFRAFRTWRSHRAMRRE